MRLAAQLAAQVPAGLDVIPGVDIDLELVADDEPGFSRRPDLLIVNRDAIERVRFEGGLLRASEAVLVVEVTAPDQSRIDTVDKRAEAAAAGIPWYWIVDISDPISLVACRGIADDQRASGTFSTTEPFPITLELDRLR